MPLQGLMDLECANDSQEKDGMVTHNDQSSNSKAHGKSTTSESSECEANARQAASRNSQKQQGDKPSTNSQVMSKGNVTRLIPSSISPEAGLAQGEERRDEQRNAHVPINEQGEARAGPSCPSMGEKAQLVEEREVPNHGVNDALPPSTAQTSQVATEPSDGRPYFREPRPHMSHTAGPTQVSEPTGRLTRSKGRAAEEPHVPPFPIGSRAYIKHRDRILGSSVPND